MEKELFINYLEGKGLANKTIAEYVRLAELFLERTQKEDWEIEKIDVLRFLEYLKNRGLQNASRRIYLFAINHYFTFLFKAEQIAKNPCWSLKIRGIKQKKLYKIYTCEELDQLFDNYYQFFVRNYDDSCIPENIRKQSALCKERNALIVNILINQGITTAELDKIEISDLDLVKATIKIRGGKVLNSRTLPLKASQIGLIMNYLQKIRPQLLELQGIESKKLFLPLPISAKRQMSRRNNVFIQLTVQIESIDKQFINFCIGD